MRRERDDARERAELAEEDGKKLRAEADRLRRIVEAKDKEVSNLKEQLKEASRIKNGDCGGRTRDVMSFRCGSRCKPGTCFLHFILPVGASGAGRLRATENQSERAKGHREDAEER